MVGTFCPRPGPLGPENIIPSRLRDLSIRGSPAKKGVCEEKQLEKCLRGVGLEACSGPRRRWARRSPPPGKPPGSQLHGSWLPALGQTQTDGDWQRLGLGACRVPGWNEQEPVQR